MRSSTTSRDKHGIARFGLMANDVWNRDPKRTVFMLARYKFVGRMMSGRKHVLEVGCADAFGTRLVQQNVEKVTAIDFDPVFIADAKERMNPHWPYNAFVHDVMAAPVPARSTGPTLSMCWSTSRRRTKTASSGTLSHR